MIEARKEGGYMVLSSAPQITSAPRSMAPRSAPRSAAPSLLPRQTPHQTSSLCGRGTSTPYSVVPRLVSSVPWTTAPTSGVHFHKTLQKKVYMWNSFAKMTKIAKKTGERAGRLFSQENTESDPNFDEISELSFNSSNIQEFLEILLKMSNSCNSISIYCRNVQYLQFYFDDQMVCSWLVEKRKHLYYFSSTMSLKCYCC